MCNSCKSVCSVKNTLAAFFSLVLASCAAVPTTTINASQWKQEASGKHVELVVYQPVNMTVLTPGQVAGGGLINLMTKPDGSNLSLPAPSYLLAEKLKENLSARTGVSFVKTSENLRPLPIEKDLSSYKQRTTANYVLEVAVPYQYLGYRPTAWSTYGYRNKGIARLIRISDTSVIWSYECDVGTGSDSKNYELQNYEFAANDGQKLKAILSYAADQCSKTLVSHFMNETK